jgi:hypothetical protein
VEKRFVFPGRDGVFGTAEGRDLTGLVPDGLQIFDERPSLFTSQQPPDDALPLWSFFKRVPGVSMV